MIDRKKVLLSLVVLATLVASITMIVGNVGGLLGVHAQQASANSVTSTDFYVPIQNANPWGTAFDSSGNVWVALPGCDFTPNCSSKNPGTIARYNPATSSWTSYPLSSGYGQPIFLAFDKQGILWFTMPSTNSIGMLNPTNGTIQQFAVPTAASGPWGITVDSTGIVWFTEHYTNQIGSFNPTTHQFHEIATAAANSVPYGITVDASNNVWFTENNPAAPAIDEYPAGGGGLKVFPVPTNGSNNLTPHLITVDTSNNIWWSEGWVGKIGKLNVAQASSGTSNGITQYSYNLTNTHTSGISVDSNGQIWFDDSLQSIYGSFPESGTGAFSIYNTPTQNAHPHDGLNVDKQNRVWFNEQFANKLAVATQSGGSTPTPTATTSPTSTPTPGQVLAKDTFQRANQAHWGNASDGQTWGGDANTASAFSITNNTGVVANSGNNNYSAVLGPSTANSEVLVTGSLSTFANANIGAVLRWTDTNDWYKAYISGNTFYIQKKVAGNATFLTSAAFTAQANTSYTIRFQTFGTTLNAKVWATGSTEPTAWTVTATDTSLTTGYAGVRVLTQSGTATVTSFQVTALTTQSGGGTPTVTPTVGTSPTVTPTVGTSPTVTPTMPTSGQVLATDTFQRANQAHWGNASDGQAWGGDANTVSAFSITNNAGVASNGGSTSYSAVLGPSATNAEGLVSGSLSSYANANFGAVLRWTDGNNWYKAYIDGATFYIQKKVAGTATLLTSTAFAAQANTSYTIRFQVSGSTLNAKVWATSGTEPSAWTLTTTDTSLTAGYCGIRALTQSGTVTFTSFKATAI